jgi:hypothetical protein
MSGQLIHVFLGDTPTHLDDAQAEGEPQLLWKVVLRTGTWKLRPGPGGVKLKAPLKIFRDKAPKGHISLAELKKNFEGDDKGPAKEHVTVPMVHADGTTSDGGFVKKLVIQDVAGEDGSGVKESLLWAGLEITDSDLKKKLDEKSIRGVSGGILFDYERTEDAKKFSQILSHVMVTNSPWINGTGEFKDKLPEGVMASEPDDLRSARWSSVEGYRRGPDAPRRAARRPACRRAAGARQGHQQGRLEARAGPALRRDQDPQGARRVAPRGHGDHPRREALPH